MTAATLPLPIRFDLPGPEWKPADPGSLGVPDAAFVAVRAEMPGDYTPVLSIKGKPHDGPLEAIADELVDGLRGTGDELEVVSRRTSGDADAPALIQVVGLTVTADGTAYDLRQLQVVVGYVDVHTRAQIVLVHTLTCTYAQEAQLSTEFQHYVRSVRVVTDDDGTVVDPTDGKRPQGT